MDCDYDPNQANMDEMIDMSRRNKSRRKSVFAKKLESKKPTFNPEEYVYLWGSKRILKIWLSTMTLSPRFGGNWIKN